VVATFDEQGSACRVDDQRGEWHTLEYARHVRPSCRTPVNRVFQAADETPVLP
jgi:hypothetical protein